MNIRNLLKKNKPQQQEKVEEKVKKDEFGENSFNFYNTFNKQEIDDLRKSYKQLIDFYKSNEPNLFNNSIDGDVNLITQSLTDRMRDLYNTFGQNLSLQYLTSIIRQEGFVPLGLYEYHIEMLLKNELFVKRIIDIPINISLGSYSINNQTYDKYNIPMNNIHELISRIYVHILNAVFRSEVYGGCYVVVSTEGIRLYQMSQISSYQIWKQNTNAHGYSQLYLFNQMLKSRKFDLNWLKENKMEYIEFNDGYKVPYNNLFLLTSTSHPKGQFMEKMLNGFNLSTLEGALHHFWAILQDLESLHKQLSIQNRVIFRVAKFSSVSKIATARQMSRINTALQQLVATRTTDGFVTDKENEVQNIPGVVQIREIIDYVILKLSSLLFGIPLATLTGETSGRYVNTEIAKEQQKTSRANMNVLQINYSFVIKEILYRYISLYELHKKNIKTGEIEILNKEDYNISYE